MRHVFGIFIAIAMLCVSFPASADAQEVYQYTGNEFSFFIPDMATSSYIATDRVTATLSLHQALLGDLDRQSIKGFPGFSLVMNDGQQELNSSTSTIVEAVVSTDADGNITGWYLLLVCCGEDLSNKIGTANYVGQEGVGDLGFLDAIDQALNLGAPGEWSREVLTSTQSVDGLIDDIVALVGVELNRGQARGLTQLLMHAHRSIGAGNTRAACNQIEAFIRQVVAKTPPLSAETSTALLEAGLGQQLLLGCHIE